MHRLDLGTSGVLVLANNKKSATKLMSAFEERAISKQYLAICRVDNNSRGTCTAVGESVTVSAAIGNPPTDTQSSLQGQLVKSPSTTNHGRQTAGQRAARVICAEEDGGKPAETDLEVLARVDRGTDGIWVLVRAKPLQGRTHQVRIHLAHAGLPITGDSLYGGSQWVKRSPMECKVGEEEPARQ